MQTFDYELAWAEVARPAFYALPQNVRDLLARVTAECANLHQLSDCSMPWPEDSDLRSTFDKIPAEVLALSARVVYFYGHWRPGKTVAGDALPAGESRKFSHYADQSLRARLGLAERGAGKSYGPSFEIHQGAVRVCYSSHDMWAWEEVAPATVEGLKYAETLRQTIFAAIGALPERQRHERDSAAYAAVQAMKALPVEDRWGSPYWPRFLDTSAYMAEESEIEARREARRPEPDREAMKARIRKECDERIAKVTRKATIERDGHLWLIDHKIPVDNVIYYDHTGRWAFGWRKPIPDDLKSRMLDVLAEFPFNYDFVVPKY